MINDIVSILWKEWRELFRQRGLRSALVNWGVMVFLIGVLMPTQVGAEWFSIPMLSLIWCWMPMLAVAGTVTDAFAGERERHTLETLLASRMPDRGIFAGKLLTSVLFGWSIQLGGLMAATITINVTYGKGQFLFYSLDFFAVWLVITLLLMTLISAIGVLVSLRSSTVRQAYQKMSLAFLALVFIPTILGPMLPSNMLAAVNNFLVNTPPVPALWAACAVFLVFDLGLVAFGLARFQRARLILD
ncbi:MAG TPA: ABC transporter permease subunit [Anaerolineaceae bacterium]|nr:ABC transporter permease subunit [Anaerolineaceae bacterium]HPN51348.1 ABC transporter permease subunit [Anaerolineaceae bacterium]